MTDLYFTDSNNIKWHRNINGVLEEYKENYLKELEIGFLEKMKDDSIEAEIISNR